MCPECARGIKHPVSFAVSVQKIAPFSMLIKNELKLGHLLFFLIWLYKPAVIRNQTHSRVVLFNRSHHSYDIIDHSVCILCSHCWNLLLLDLKNEVIRNHYLQTFHVRHILPWRLGHENITTAILPLPLIQEEQLSVTGERMCTK